MMPARFALLSALCAFSSPSADSAPVQPVLAIDIAAGVVSFHVKGPQQDFVGAVIASLSPELQHFVVGLPPLLTDFVVLDAGLGAGAAGYTTALPECVFPPGLFVYVQGITLLDGVISSTDVGSFVLDAAAPEKPGGAK